MRHALSCVPGTRIGPVLVAVMASACFAEATKPLDMSFEMVITRGKGHVQTLKFSLSGQKSRMESDGGVTPIKILRRDRNVMWMLSPAKQQYVERPLGPVPVFLDPAAEPKGSKERLGTEDVLGYSCTKYRFTIGNPAAKQPMTSLAWFAEKLQMNVRTETGSMVTELHNIKLGPQPAALFEVPDGYEKVEMAALLGSEKANGKAKTAEGADAKLPEWLPAYPGSTCKGRILGPSGRFTVESADSFDQVVTFYEEALKKAGFETSRNYGYDGDGEIRMVSINAPGDDKNAIVSVWKQQAGKTRATIMFSDRGLK